MTVGILGLGLIGGSLARAYALEGHRVLCADRDEDMLCFAMLAGAVEGSLNEETISQCDLLLLAIYPDGSATWLEHNAKHIRQDCLVIDCCGIKREICQRCFPLAKKHGFTFIGGHPMAGTQFSGFKYSRADLFEGAPMVLVPDRFDDMQLLERAKKALTPCHFGSFSVTTAAEHDRMIAFLSQLTHCIAVSLMTCKDSEHLVDYTGDSFRDLTRIAKINEDMWCELFLLNKTELLSQMDLFIDKFKELKDSIECSDTEKIKTIMRTSTQRRRYFDK